MKNKLTLFTLLVISGLSSAIAVELALQRLKNIGILVDKEEIYDQPDNILFV